jgi:hypothetical protein
LIWLKLTQFERHVSYNYTINGTDGGSSNLPHDWFAGIDGNMGQDRRSRMETIPRGIAYQSRPGNNSAGGGRSPAATNERGKDALPHRPCSVPKSGTPDLEQYAHCSDSFVFGKNCPNFD